MRILMLSQFYPPTIGGAEQHVQTLSAQLVARGHDVAVATLWHPRLPEFELDGRVRVYRIRGTTQRAAWLFSQSGRRHAPPFPDPEAVAGLRRIIARERPRIVHAHNWLVYSFLPLQAWSGAQLIMTLHDYNLRCATITLTRRGAVCDGPGLVKCLTCAAEHYGLAKGVPTVLGNWMMGALERAAVDMFLPVSHAVAAGSGLVGRHLPYQVMPNFTADDMADLADDAEPCLTQLPTDAYLLFVGPLSRPKGVDVLLRAYRDLPQAPPLVLIGYPTPDLHDLVANLSGQVLVLHNWPHRAVMRAWQRSLLGLVPSVCADACPTVAIEAMAAGRPVVGSHIGGLPDLIVDGQTGLLVAPGDASALRRAIEHLLGDRDLRERMGRAAQHRAGAFRASAVVPRIERVYEEVLLRKGRSQHAHQAQPRANARDNEACKGVRA